MGAAAAQVFGPSQPGFVIIILVVLAVGAWLGEMLTAAIGKVQFAAMIRIGSYIAAILSVVAVAWKLLTIFFNFTQGKM